ncbi:MAG TPA: Crp/Fnr family transcriptional regulator [Chryseosolibacter sp.]|nr:Crp/Fnr family transcriptional regulator [Chryseosolibacter sp.]
MKETIIDFLRQRKVMSEEFERVFTEALLPVSLPADAVLLHPPQVPDHIYFMSKGFAMSYTYQEHRRFVGNFYQPGQVILSNNFFDQTHTDTTIVLTEPSEMLALSFTRFHSMVDNVPDANQYYRLMVPLILKDMQTRINDLQKLTAQQRLVKLWRLYPTIERSVSQDAIASYLGITPQSLSRIKRKLQS